MRRCQAEYDDPADRRFHAQPNACPDLRPAAAAGRPPAGAGTTSAPGVDPLRAAVAALQAGGIVAVKGIGGFHLACLAGDERAVAALRARKHREDKPFALMAPRRAGGERARAARAGRGGAARGRDRPIVLAPRRPGARVAAAVAPRSAELGVLLPYSPLHHLLLADVGGAARDDQRQRVRRADRLPRRRRAGAPVRVADVFLLHDRPIDTRTDDSVLRVARGRPLPLRRSRGDVPSVLALPVPAPRHVLACGAELKSTFCLARGRRAWVSHHVGDLKNVETLGSFQEGVAHFERLFAVAPGDRRPRPASRLPVDDATRSRARASERVAVQHHHAHLAACLAEHGETGAGGRRDLRRRRARQRRHGLGRRAPGRRPARLRASRPPVAGGAAGRRPAAREPWRMACAWRVAAGGDPRPLRGVDEERWRAVARIAETGFGVARDDDRSGRLFDAVAALCGLRAEVNYEGQAAMELEAACDPSERGAYPLRAVAGVLDARETILAVERDVSRGVATGAIAARFHHALADATAAECAQLAADRGLEIAVLSGGVFQNRRAARAHVGRPGAGRRARPRARAAAAERRRHQLRAGGRCRGALRGVVSQLQAFAIAMTRPHSAVPLVEAPDIESAAAVVRSRGLRLSTARRLVLESLYATDEPLTADRIAGDLDVASVYRNLETLEQIGLVRHFHLGHGPGLYTRASAGRYEYLLCDACGAVMALEPERLDAVRDRIRSDFGYEARFTHFPIAGLCPDCADEDV